ncbi:hypothetical protein LX97_01875 [Nonlabens dokdonensis]|jgi:hypothetical protein|uniref:Uncharacterized protein n=2 Tax=Nonlabens dokdonensis TaxID=328515 RepID=L7W628_NONDD|nr:hypothetical protein [Nonlabens dokdonensis]AGC77135.1 hypothetical protein DDD_2008 [Nonlabens dokdonensis DSW-6]PZX41094.1 hypothetical protein LX97_01875 [Nonlabens dokdonensis]
MEKDDKKLSLSLKQVQLIMSYPIYFQHTITQAALLGESIEEVAEELEKDWACFT